jgi:hypothetical protein
MSSGKAVTDKTITKNVQSVNKHVKKDKVKVEDLLSSALGNTTLYVSDSRL